MKSLLVLFIALALVSLAHAAHDVLLTRSHHRRISMLGTSLSRRQAKSSCTTRPQSASSPAKGSSDDDDKKSSDDDDKPDDTADLGSGSKGLIAVSAPRCGPSRATYATTKRGGVNGDIDWLNCGINSTAGWHPPFIRLQDLKVVPLDVALKDPKSPYQKCRKHFWAFEAAGKEYGIQPMILAAFALQESSCNEQTIGGAGEQGLMQITRDKCGGAPRNNCRDVGFNVRAGARYFATLLKQYNGDFLRCLGGYNGWFVGMTAKKAQAARWGPCCLCQNNLDYLQQYVNGWLQNKDAYAMGLGTWHNLRPCREH